LLPSRRLAHENTKVGGLAVMALKKLKGARLVTPLGETVVTQAIGLGVTRPISNWYMSFEDTCNGSKRINLLY